MTPRRVHPALRPLLAVLVGTAAVLLAAPAALAAGSGSGAVA